jgi:hypothetical protein
VSFTFRLIDQCILSYEHRTSQTFVKKKAALTLLRLYRKHPEIIPAKEWALRIIALMDEQDLVSLTRALFNVSLTDINNEPGCRSLCYHPGHGYGTRSSGRISS